MKTRRDRPPSAGRVSASPDSHLVAAALQRRVADQQVPDHGAQPLGVRRDRGRRTAAGSPRRRRRPGAVKPPSRPTMPKIGAPHARAPARGRGRGSPRRSSRRRRRRRRRRAARRARPRRETSQPRGEAGVPALVVDAGGQLGDVVGGRVGLEAADLAEVVDRVAGVAGRAADAEDEQPPAPSRTSAEARRPCASIASASSAATTCDASRRGTGRRTTWASDLRAPAACRRPESVPEANRLAMWQTRALVKAAPTSMTPGRRQPTTIDDGPAPGPGRRRDRPRALDRHPGAERGDHDRRVRRLVPAKGWPTPASPARS